MASPAVPDAFGRHWVVFGVAYFVVLGIALAAAIWWAYFDLARLSAERRLSAAQEEERARLAAFETATSREFRRELRAR